MADINRPQAEQKPVIGETEQDRASRAAAATIESVTRRAGGAAAGAVRAGGEAVQHGMTASADAAGQGTRALGEVVRHGGEAGAETLRQTGEAAGETIRRSAQVAAEGQRRIAEDAAKQWEEMGRKVAQAVSASAQDIRALMVVPRPSAAGAQDVQHAFSGLVDGVVRTNLRATQELLRLANPGAVVELQQRFVREYLDALVEGGAVLLRATRRATDETLRPLEEQLEQRKQQRQQGGHNGRSGRVADVMTRGVRVTSPEDTVQQAARLMREEDVGVLPVGENDRLVGMVTDRDVTIRLVAEGKDPARTKVREVMTPDVQYVFEDEDMRHVAANMEQNEVRRMPVVNRDKRLVGIVTLDDVAQPAAAA